MENATKAMLIAGSTLLAVIILAVMIYGIRNTGRLAEQKQVIEQTEQLAAFNKEYEAYNKKIMYGVDVLSCINKARSNNEKYVAGGSNISGFDYPAEYIIDVAFKLKDPLQDRFRVYYYPVSSLGKVSSKQTEYTNGDGPNSDGGKQLDSDATYSNIFGNKIQISTWNSALGTNIPTGTSGGSNIIKSGTFSSTKYTSSGYFHLLKNHNELNEITDGSNVSFVNSKKDYFTKPDTEPNIITLFDMANSPKINVSHKLTSSQDHEDFSMLKYMCKGSYDGHSYAGWTSVEWDTALYDFKTRKFECQNILYSSATGRVVCLVFKEK